MSVSNFKELRAHHGHDVAVMVYGGMISRDGKEPVDEEVNVAIECLDCNEVLIDFDHEDVEKL